MNINTASLQETLYVQPKVLSEGKCVDMIEERGCEASDEDVPEEVKLAKDSTLKKLSLIFIILKAQR